jgi:hypothetical protein
VLMSNRKKLSKIAERVPVAWLRCNLCFGTGYVFSPSRAGIKDNTGGTVATMTNDRCETCLGIGFIQFLDA